MEDIMLCAKGSIAEVSFCVVLACFKCGTDVIVAKWNIGKKLVCPDCVKILIDEGRCDPLPRVKLQDLIAAKNYLSELRSNDVSPDPMGLE